VPVFHSWPLPSQISLRVFLIKCRLDAKLIHKNLLARDRCARRPVLDSGLLACNCSGGDVRNGPDQSVIDSHKPTNTADGKAEFTRK
jgi:hypothetical protein